MRDLFESADSVYLVFDYMRGGELLDKIARQKFFSEREAKAVMERVVSVVRYLHQNGVREKLVFLTQGCLYIAKQDIRTIRFCESLASKNNRIANCARMI